MSGHMQCYGATHIGQVRSQNEDQFLIADLNKSMRVHRTSLNLSSEPRLFGESHGKLLMVADGMGGHASGERASALAIDSIATYLLNTMPWFFRLDPRIENELENDLREALQHCQQALAEEAEQLPHQQGMGTTVTLAYVLWPRLYVVHVGDSRCYICKEDGLHQLTRDHTLSELFAESNPSKQRPKGNKSAAWDNALWNVVGGNSDDLHIDIYRMTLAVGDALLLCTDGLTRHISDEQIEHFLASDASTEKICQEMIDAANHAGGKDNITAVVAKIDESGDVDNTAETAVGIPIYELDDDEPDDARKFSDTDPYMPALSDVLEE